MRRSPPLDLIVPGVPARTLDRIVVGIDFSAVSLAAAQWVRRHLARDASLMLVHVIPPSSVPNVFRRSWDRVPDPEGRLRARIRSMRGALRGLAGAIGGTSTDVEVRVGDPAVQLPAYADMVDADLLVVGGDAELHPVLRQETAMTGRLLRQLGRPGLVARHVQSEFRTVLVVLGDESAKSAFAAARRVAAPSGARVVALRMAEGVGASEVNVSARAPAAIAPAEQVRMIVDSAREQRADAVVIGSHVSDAGADGDVARLLAQTAGCSVLVVPRSIEPGPRSRMDVPKQRQRRLVADTHVNDAGPPRPAAAGCETGSAA